MPARAADYERILRLLNAHQVEFLVVGGACAVLHGVPLQTLDLDIVAERSPANAARLHAALLELEACYREHLPAKVLRPLVKDLSSSGHHLLMTGAGPLDVLGTIGAGRSYADLVANSETVDLGPALVVRILDLPTLIHVKEESPRAKDALGLTILKHTLAERQRRGS